MLNLDKHFSGGADVDVLNKSGYSLLHRAILDGNDDGAIFLLDNGSNIETR